MKIKRAVAILLVAVMLLVPASLSVVAADTAIVSGPIKVVYTDSEYFNPQGLVISVNGTEITYTPDNTKFSFVPALNEHVKAETPVIVNYKPEYDKNGNVKYTTNVDVYYNNEKVDSVTLTVTHTWGECTYIDNNFHGQYCLGCGVVKDRFDLDKKEFVSDLQAHNVDEYIPNDDGGLFIEQTETGTCTDCGHDITRNIEGSNKFDYVFSGTMTKFESELIGYIKGILVTLVQMLAGIR